MSVANRPGAALLLNSATAMSGSGFDMRNAANYAMMGYQCPAASAIVQLQAGHDGTGWTTMLTVTAVAAYNAAVISGFYPWVRAVASAVYSGGGNTGFAVVNYVPGIV